MQSGLKKVLQFRESLIDIGFQLNFQPCTLLERFLTEPAKGLEIHQADIVNSDEPMRLLHHECFRDDVGINLIRLSLADVVLPHSRGLDRVNDTDLMTFIDKVTDKVVTVVCRRFKTDDEAVIRKGIQMRGQLLEAISVVCEFERLEKYFAI